MPQDSGLTVAWHRLGMPSPGSTTAPGLGHLLPEDPDIRERLLQAHEPISDVSIHVVAPGERARVVCVKDVVQPRCKLDGAAPGAGTTVAVEDLAVVTAGPIVGFQEGIIDLSGPGARYSPFSGLGLVVLEIRVTDGTPPHEHEAAVRAAGLQAASWLAEACAGRAPARTDRLAWSALPEDVTLPRIAYVDMTLSQGLLHDTWVLGENGRDVLPRSLDPLVMIDGGIVSGNCVSACDKHTTWHHQNNPLVMRLLEGHGRAWNFVGAVVTNEPTRLAEKRRSADAAVDLVRTLRPDGAVLSKEGFGNPDADLMMLVRGLEAAGIRTVAITDEYAGRDGGSQSLADTAPEADAIVSTGNANEPVLLPPMDRVIGPLPDVARLAGGYAWSVREDGAIEVELQAIVGATNQLGAGHLTCRGV